MVRLSYLIICLKEGNTRGYASTWSSLYSEYPFLFRAYHLALRLLVTKVSKHSKPTSTSKAMSTLSTEKSLFPSQGRYQSTPSMGVNRTSLSNLEGKPVWGRIGRSARLQEFTATPQGKPQNQEAQPQELGNCTVFTGHIKSGTGPLRTDEYIYL